MMTDYLIRPETDDDREGITGLLLAAFPTSSEARLVATPQGRRCRVLAGRRGGFGCHRPCPFLKTARTGRGALPGAGRSRGKPPPPGDCRRMIEAGLERARAECWAAVVVLGDPSYYRRFGFSRKAVRSMSCRYAGPGLMGVALSGDGLDGPRIEHASAFSSIRDSN